MPNSMLLEKDVLESNVVFLRPSAVVTQSIEPAFTSE